MKVLTKEDKAIFFLGGYILAVMFGIFLGWFMYGDTLESCKEDFKTCVDAYNKDIEVKRINFPIFEVDNETKRQIQTIPEEMEENKEITQRRS